MTETITINTDKLLKIALILSVAIFGVGLVLQLICTNKLANANYDLSDFEYSKAELEKELSSLVFDNCALSSLSVVERKAFEKGFIKMQDKVLSLNVKDIPQVASLTQ